MALFGIDIYQGDDAPATPQHVDFAKMARAGAVYCVVKAGQNGWEDGLFRQHVDGATAAGLITGAYYYLDRRTSFESQARQFVELLRLRPVNLPPWLDFECVLAADGSEAGSFRLKLKAAANIVREGIGRCGLYTSRSKWAQLGTTDPAWVAMMPYLWTAQYPLKADGTYYKTLEEIANRPTPTIAPWPKSEIWQFTDRCDGLAYGLESRNGDGNRFDGTLEDLKRLCVGLGEPPAEPTDAEKLARLWEHHPELH